MRLLSLIARVLLMMGVGVQPMVVVAKAPTDAATMINVAKPFRQAPTMIGESVLFIRPDDGKPATASLLFTPQKIL